MGINRIRQSPCGDRWDGLAGDRVTQWITQTTCGLVPCGDQFHANRRSLRGFGLSSVRAIRRTGNAVAHHLAKEGCENKVSKTWLGIPLAFIVSTMEKDLSVS